MRIALALALALLAAACGEDAPNIPDAAPVRDGATPVADAPPDAMPAPVTVTVLSEDGTEAPVADAVVVFIEASGAVTRASTDSAGVATALVGPGSSVTVVRPNLDGGADLTTTLGVMPGDHLRYGRRNPRFNNGPVLVSTAMTWAAPPTASAYFQLYTRCGYTFVNGGASTSATVAVGDRCGTGPRDLLLVAFDGAGTARWFQLEPAFTPGPTYAFAGTWEPTVTSAINLSNVPTNIDGTNGSVYQALRGVDAGAAFFPSTAGQPTITSSVVLPNLPASQLTTGFRMFRSTFGQVEILNTTPFSTQLALDVGAAMLPWLVQPTIDLTQRSLSWGEEGPGQPDLIVLDVNYSRGQAFYRWTVLAPGALPANLVQLPDLPAEVGDVEPQAGDSAGGNVRYFRFSGGGWDAVRGEADLNVEPYSYDFSSQPDLTQVTASGFILKG